MDSANRFAIDLSTLAPLDWVGVGLVVLLVVMGLWHGLWWQVIRLAGILAAVAVARSMGPSFAEWIAEQWPELPARFAHGGAWFTIFFGVLLVATVLGYLGQKMLETMKLGMANRLGGAALGAATGILLHVAVLLVLCQLAPEPFVGRVVAGTYSEKIVEAVGERWEVVVDKDAAKEIQRLLRGESGEQGPPGEPGAGAPAAPGSADV